MATFQADMVIPSNSLPATTLKTNAEILRTQMKQESSKRFPVRLRDLFVHDTGAALPASATSDDLGFTVGTFGTAPPIVESSDGSSTTVTQYARVEFIVPLEYETGQTIELVVNANMATVSDSTATVDVECYESTREGAVGSDLCSTAAQSINSATAADYTFTIDGTGLAAGDHLDLRLTVAITDSATGSGVTAALNAVDFLVDVRG